MKKIIASIIILASIGLSTVTNAQAPNWAWAKSAGGIGNDYGNDGGNSVSTDASGNVFVTGWFTSPTITFGTTTLTNADTTRRNADFFIVKYDATGNVLWAKSAGGTGDDVGVSVSTDASGNVFLTGYFTSPTITFGTTTLSNAKSFGSYYYVIFIAKYDAAGNVLWAKSAGGIRDDGCTSVSTDASGNVFLTGYFESPTITFGTTTLTNEDNLGYSSDIFIAKYDAMGNVLWAKSAGGMRNDRGTSVSTDASGNVFLTGQFESTTITFGANTLTNTDNTGNNYDIFIAKYDAAGNVLWAKSAGGIDLDYGTSVSTDASGNVFLTGYFFSPTITFGTTTLSNPGWSTANGPEIFIAKYDAAGNVLWAKSAGGSGYDGATSVSTDVSGNVFLMGYFYSPTITFGATTLTNSDTNGYSPDIFIAKYDASGNVLWAKLAGESGVDWGNSVSTDARGNVFLTGWFVSIITFGTTTLTNADTNGNTGDIFLAKIDANSTAVEELQTHDTLSIIPNPTSNSITVTLGEDNTSASYELFDVLGMRVRSGVVTSREFQLNVASLVEGTYYLRLISPNATPITQKVVVLR